MKKSELYRLSLAADKWKHLSWRQTIFNLSILPDDFKPADYDLDYKDELCHYYLDGEWKEIEDAVKGEPLYHPNEEYLLLAGDWGNNEDLYTTYGRALTNFTVWKFSVGTRFDYVNEFILPDAWLEKNKCEIVDDDSIPEGGNYITATEMGKFAQGIQELKVLAPMVTSTGSEITLTTHPDMDEVRERLIKEAGDDITKAVTVSNIIEKLDKLDKEWLSQDHSIEYYSSPKSRNRRRKLYVIEGVSTAFKDDGTFTLQSDPLLARWKKSDMVTKFNDSREGAYQRGSETAKGGEKVVFLQSTFQNHVVKPGNCGAKPLNVEINDFNYKNYVGLNHDDGKTLTPLSEEDLKKAIGTALPIRRAFLCKEEHVDFCSSCASLKYAEVPRAIANETSSIGSYIMYGSMSAMHATDLKVAEFITNYHIS